MARRTTTGKPSAGRATGRSAAKTSAAKKPEARSPVALVETTSPTDAPTEAVKVFTKRDLIERVVAASGIKKKTAKPVIEAMLLELGEALTQFDTLNLQPLGKGIVKSRKDVENAQVTELRLRRGKLAVERASKPSTGPGAGPLAEPVN